MARSKRNAEVVKRYTEKLAVKLDEKTIRARGNELAVAEGQLEQHLIKAKDVRSKQNKRTKELQAEISRLATAVRDGEEAQDITVEARMAKAPGFIDIVRTDTGETIETRAMEDKDRQLELAEGDDADEDDEDDEDDARGGDA